MNNNKVVLITGASSGIGKACALHLDKSGFKVFAGVRKYTDGEKLKKEASSFSKSKLTPVIIDVTNNESIQSAFEFIEKETAGSLYALINNAGVGHGGALELTPVDEMKKVFDINVVGLMATTKAFLPLLRNSKGRIVNIGSSTGLIAFPGAGVYAASKFAVRAISDSLRIELKMFGISVILLVSGHVKTEMWSKEEKYKERNHNLINPEISELYTPLIKFGDKIVEETPRIPVKEVAQIVAESLSVTKPKAYYYAGDAKTVSRLARLPKRLLDKMFYSRIIKMK